MKQIITPLLFLSFIVFSLSCDDSFLEENKKQIDGYELDTYLFVNPTNVFTEVSALLPDLKNKNFKVVQYPTLIQFESLNGRIDGMGNLTFKIKVGHFNSDISIEPLELGHILLDISDFGMLSIPIVHLNYGVQKAKIDVTSFDFETKLSEGMFEISNNENGVLWYRLTEKPSWVTIQQTSLIDEFLELDKEKVVGPSNDYRTSYTIYPDRNKLTPGEHEGKILIETSDPSNPVFEIKVKITILSFENPESMKTIKGTVIDAIFDKTTNTLYYITLNPTKLFSYNTDTGSEIEKTTERAPESIRFSADKKTIMVGESGMLELIDAATLVTKEKIELPFTISEIEDGENGYYYLTNKENDIFSLNSATKEWKKQSVLYASQSYIKADMLVKAEGKPHLLFYRKGYSSNGLYLVDFSDPENLSSINYWYEGFGSRIFTSANKEYVYSINDGRVYRFPDETTPNDIYHLGRFIPDGTNYESYYYFNWFDHNTSTSSIWASYKFHSEEKNAVIEFDDKTLERRRVVSLNDYVATINGKKDYYKTLAHYLFSDKDGDKFAVIKNVDEYNANAWHLEILDISK